MLPPELVDTIVEEIEDTEDLKSCSLAASVFRYACQKRLLATLSLGSHLDTTRRTYDEAVAHFGAAPHLASLVVNLRINILTTDVIAATPPQLNSLFAVLTRVDSCTISSYNGRWGEIPQKLSVAVGHWVSLIPSGTIHRFRIEYIHNVPQQLIHDIFKAIAPHCSLSFTDISIAESESANGHSYTPPPFHLRLFSSHTDPHLLLTEPSFLRYAECVAQLTAYVAHYKEIFTALRICAAATRTLEQLRLIFLDAMKSPRNDATIETPLRLLSLTLLELRWTRLDVHLKFDHNFSWILSEVLAPLLRPGVTPNLAQINLDISLLLSLEKVDQVVLGLFPSTTDLALLRQLDDILAGRATGSGVALCFVFRTNSARVREFAKHVDALLEALRNKLPNQARRNLLSVVAESWPLWSEYW